MELMAGVRNEEHLGRIPRSNQESLGLPPLTMAFLHLNALHSAAQGPESFALGLRRLLVREHSKPHPFLLQAQYCCHVLGRLGDPLEH